MIVQDVFRFIIVYTLSVLKTEPVVYVEIQFRSTDSNEFYNESIYFLDKKDPMESQRKCWKEVVEEL